jgi:multidrug resistance efflux pump
MTIHSSWKRKSSQTAPALLNQALKAAEHRMGRLEQAVHDLDANLEQENLDKQNAQKAVAKSREVSRRRDPL